MAVTVQTQVSNQPVGEVNSYCYLYEPMRVTISETDSTATKIYIKLIARALEDTTTIVAEEEAYGEYDLNTAKTLTVDLMKLAQQYHNANVYKTSAMTTLTIPIDGWQSIVSKYVYEFQVSSDVSTAPIIIKKLPVIGVRRFSEINGLVSFGGMPNTPDLPLNEFEKYGVDVSQRWGGYSIPQITMGRSDVIDARPTISLGFVSTEFAPEPCAGMLYWKSRLGGWMYWGMDLKKKSQKKKYTGNIPTGMYEQSYGIPYVEADYTGIETSYNVTLKALSLTSDELAAVQDIIASPAVYYNESRNHSMELMRLTSASAPIDNKTNGGDFSVSLASISNSSQMTR